MKLSAILILLIFSESAFSQDFWHSANGPLNGKVTSIAMDSSLMIFAGTSNGGVYRSADNSNLWTQINSGLTNTDIRTIVINSSGIIFAGTFGSGIFISTDHGDSWNSSNAGLTNPFIYSLALSPNGYIFAGTGQRCYRSTNIGSNWTPVTSGFPASSVMSLTINSAGHLFAATLGSGLYRSTNNGDQWILKDSGISNPDIKSVAVNANGIVFAGTFNGVYRSTNNGESWQRKDSGITSVPAVYAIAFNSNNDVFIGKFGGGVYSSSDSGEFWTQKNSGLPDLNVNSLTAARNGFIYTGTNGSGVFKSINTITNISQNGLPVKKIEELQNYPNPFNPVTLIHYSLSESNYVNLKVFDVSGKQVSALVDRKQEPGSYDIEFAGGNLPGGVYFYSLVTGSYIQTKKMILIK
ncbi:MAG TPA: T9SS type A sorting domain-containing protein [Ignavibacteria bacterium]|nr:T9SS type A sorting domain-containing protein [Ignavibacteria bacterium]